MNQKILQIINKVRTTLIGIPLIKFAYKIKFFIFKRALNLRVLLQQKLKYQLRLLIPEAKLAGFDKHLDSIIHISSIKFLVPEVFQDNPPEFLRDGLPNKEWQKIYSDLNIKYKNNEKQVDDFCKTYGQDEVVLEIICCYNLARHFTSTRESADYFLSRAKAINPEASLLKPGELFKLWSSIKKDIKTLRKKIADRQATKISLSIEKTGALISIVSCCFIISGYIYNRIFLGAFGIEVSKYFTLSDYLASSIESIRYAVTGALLAIIVCFLGVHDVSQKSSIQIEDDMKVGQILLFGLFMFTLIATILNYLDNSESFYYAVFTLVLLASYFFIPMVSAKYFKEPLVALFIMVFLINYSIYLLSSTGRAIYQAKNYPFEKIQRYDVKFKDKLPIDESNTALLAGNSTYLFILNRERDVLVIPRDQVLYIKSRKKLENKLNWLQKSWAEWKDT